MATTAQAHLNTMFLWAIGLTAAIALFLSGISVWLLSWPGSFGFGPMMQGTSAYGMGPAMMGHSHNGMSPEYGIGSGLMRPGYGIDFDASGDRKETVAGALGLTVEQFSDARQSGKSVEVLAREQDVALRIGTWLTRRWQTSAVG